MEQQPSTKTYIDVTYFPGMTTFGTLPARLEVKDDRLVLTTSEGTKESPIYKEVFNASIAEIQKVRSMLDEMRIVINDKSHRVSVAQYASPVMAAGGVAGTAVAAGMYKKTGADQFLALLKDKGVTVSHLGFGKTFGLAAIVAILLVAIALGIFFLI